MPTLRSAHLVALVLLLLVTPVAEAGWLFVDEGGNQTSLSRGRLKMAPKESQGMAMSLDIGRARMWVADAGKKTYWEGTVEEYCQAMRATMSGAMADMEKQMAESMKDMPPAQREQMQQMQNKRCWPHLVLTIAEVVHSKEVQRGRMRGRGGKPNPPSVESSPSPPFLLLWPLLVNHIT